MGKSENICEVLDNVHFEFIYLFEQTMAYFSINTENYD